MSRPRTRHQATDAMIGASSIGAVIAGMSILNDDVRTAVASAIAGDQSGQLTALAFSAQRFGHDLVRSAADYRAANGPLVAFGVVAVVLAFLMFRT